MWQPESHNANLIQHQHRENCTNQPDITIKTRKRSTVISLTYLVCCKNVAMKTSENLPKYKMTKIKLQHMWNTKTTIIPVVVGALGLISKNMKRYLLEKQFEISLTNIQKTVLLGTTYIWENSYQSKSNHKPIKNIPKWNVLNVKM